MQAIDAALMRRRYRKRPIRVDGLSDLEVDMNEMRSIKASVKALEPLPWEARSYGEFFPGVKFRNLAMMAADDEGVLNAEKAKLEAGPIYEGRDADLSRINAAINKVAQTFDFRTEQSRIAAEFVGKKQLLAAVATSLKQPGQGVPNQGELLRMGVNVEKLVQILTEDIGATRYEIMERSAEIARQRAREKAIKEDQKVIREGMAGSRYPDTRSGRRDSPRLSPQSTFAKRRTSPQKTPPPRDRGGPSDLTKVDSDVYIRRSLMEVRADDSDEELMSPSQGV